MLNHPSSFQVITRDSVRSLIVPQSDQIREPPPLILSRSDFERILNAAKVSLDKAVGSIFSQGYQALTDTAKDTTCLEHFAVMRGTERVKVGSK